jgi:cyclopropane-fatty-acyl-phospholipid synthase
VTFRSSLYIGSVMHRRLKPRAHHFRYRAFWLLLDVDELPHLARKLRLFSHNRPNLVSLYDKDHGDGSATPLRLQAKRRLAEAGIDFGEGPILLLCMPRTLGFSFNPLSVYFCHSANGDLVAVIYQVHNTFGERHDYVLSVAQGAAPVRQACRKTFFVSPFMETDLNYEFRLIPPGERIAVAIRAGGVEGTILYAIAAGTRNDLNDRKLLRLCVTIPVVTLKVISAIHWQGVRLILKGLRYRSRRSEPKNFVSFEQQCAQQERALARLAQPPALHARGQRGLPHFEFGRLRVTTPAGKHMTFRGVGSGPYAQIGVRSWRALWRLLAGGDIGFADAYLAGQWTTPNITELLLFAAQNSPRPSFWRTLPRPFVRLQHARNHNSKSGSRRNIAAHYDLGNDFFSHWLDAGMSYSSALYADENDNLEDAQMRKLDRVIDLAELSDGEKVLEIGCGWGALAERIIARHDCSVTAINLSARQLDYARQRLSDRGLGGSTDLRMQDYRDVEGTYDRIVSVEMLEAVGEAYWPTFFGQLAKLLRPGGIAVLQSITIRDALFDTYRRRPDYIQKYIFPGGFLPTMRIIARECEAAGLELVSTDFFANSYARTLAEWQRRFQGAWPAISSLGFDERFKRMWEYYLAYCQAGFTVGTIDVGHYKLVRQTS